MKLLETSNLYCGLVNKIISSPFITFTYKYISIILFVINRKPENTTVTSDFSKDGAIPADFTSAHKRDSLPVGTFLAPGAYLNVTQLGFIRVQLGGARTAHWAQI